MRRSAAALSLLLLVLGGCVPQPQAAGLVPLPPVAKDLSSYLARPATLGLPARIPGDRVIAEVVALQARDGGATYNCYFGSLSGQKLYAVSLFPEVGRKLKGKVVSSEVLRAFLADRQGLLKDPRCSVGTWYDGASGCTYVDISATLADKAQAVGLGKQYNQISIFDLAALKEIPTGGSGKALRGWPPVGQRLPKLPMATPAPLPGQVVPAS